MNRAMLKVRLLANAPSVQASNRQMHNLMFDQCRYISKPSTGKPPAGVPALVADAECLDKPATFDDFALVAIPVADAGCIP